MTLELFINITNLLQTAVLAVVLFLVIRLLLKNIDSLTVVFISFFFSLWFLATIYWLVYDILRPDVRMPFAANEIGEAGMLLMLSAALNHAVPHGSRAAIKQMIGATVFAVCNCILWIAWSGEWLQDLITGLVFVWLLSSVVCSLKVIRALTKTEWILLGIYCAVLIAGQCLTFFFEEPVKGRIDLGCYILLTIGVIYWLAKFFISWKRKEPAKKLMALALTNIVWITVALFMSSDLFYYIYINVETLISVFLYLAARKVVTES